MLPELRDVVETRDHVQVYLREADLPVCDQKELQFWSRDERYNRKSSLWENLRIKGGEIRMFEELMPLLEPKAGQRILELGAGQAWASLMLKRAHPDCEVHASELSPEAMLGAEKWERLLETRLDGYWACPAERTPFADEQFDTVYTFAAFHHFAIGGRGESALREALRLLKPGGRLVLIAEPTSPAWCYAWSKRRLDAIRQGSGFDIEEDVLVPEQMRAWATSAGATMQVRFDTSWSWREIRLSGVLRNAAVAVFPALGWWVPMGAHFVFTRER